MYDEHTSPDFRTPPGFRARQIVRKMWRALMRPRVVQRDRLIVMDDDVQEHCDNPVFLAGVHRSGTSLLRRIVDSHSSIACPPETFILTAFSEMLGDNRFREGLETMGFDRGGIARGLRHGLDYFFEAYRRSKGKPRWADKTPEYIRILPFIEAVFGPGCQYVMIYRHPFDVVNSLMATGWDFSLDQWRDLNLDEDPFRNVSLYHADLLTRQLDFESIIPDRCHRVHYESLATRPDEILPPMFEFLGEPWEPAVLDYHEQHHDHGTGDPRSTVTKGFKPSIGHWKGWPRLQIELGREILGDVIQRLGYDATT